MNIYQTIAAKLKQNKPVNPCEDCQAKCAFPCAKWFEYHQKKRGVKNGKTF